MDNNTDIVKDTSIDELQLKKKKVKDKKIKKTKEKKNKNEKAAVNKPKGKNIKKQKGEKKAVKPGIINKIKKQTIETAKEKSSLPVTKQIKFKLIVSFLIPVIFIVTLGLLSYTTAKKVIVKSYETTALNTVNSGANYVNLLMKDVESRADQAVVDETFQFYFVKYETNTDVDNNTYYSNIVKTLQQLTASSVGVERASAIGQVGKFITTGYSSNKTMTYDQYITSEDGAYWNQNPSENKAWFGSHPNIDAALGTSEDYYAASFIRKFSTGNGFVIFDLLKTEVISAIEDAAVSDNSVAGFISADGREILITGKNKNISGDENVFAEYYNKANSSDKESGYEYVKYNGKKNLFVYSKVGNTGMIVCTLIPEKDILGQVSSIKILTTIFVIIATLVALFAGIYTAGGISKSTEAFSSSFKKVAGGDLTVDLDMKRRDEFGVMADNANDMISRIRGLVVDVAGFGHNVSEASIEVSESSENILDSIKNVSIAVEEMEKGVSLQVDDTENGYREMEKFAASIGEVYSTSSQIGQVADETQKIVGQGKKIVDNLKEQSISTTEMTNVIIDDINELARKSLDIGSVVETINGIAKQTNLLSLNASIEAARAGVAGRGFAVVAEEIRKLAEQSVEAVKSIEEIIEGIQEHTNKTAKTASNAGVLLKNQGEALNETVDVFEKVNDQFGLLAERINDIMNMMQEVKSGKDQVLDSIKNIAAVTEETSASTTTVRETINTEIGSVEILSARAEELTEKAKELEKAIEVFKM